MDVSLSPIKSGELELGESSCGLFGRSSYVKADLHRSGLVIAGANSWLVHRLTEFCWTCVKVSFYVSSRSFLEVAEVCRVVRFFCWQLENQLPLAGALYMG